MSRIKKSFKRKSITSKYSPDKVILFFTIFMAIFGAIMIFDASVYRADASFQGPFYFLKFQLLWIAIGGIGALLMYYWDYRKLLKLSIPILIGTIMLLILVLVLAEVTNGSRRWFEIGSLPPIQPSEFAKLGIIMYLSSWFSKSNYFREDLSSDYKNIFLKGLLRFGAIVGAIALPVISQPDLGTAVIIVVSSFSMFFIANDKREHALYAFGSLFLAFLPLGVIAAILEPYRLNRISTYIHLLLTGEVADPKGSGYQIQQILIGIGSGGLFGKGFGQSRQRFGYLVENTAFTDSIFAVILEELGFLGGTILVIAWLLFLWRGFKIAVNAPDKAGRLLAIGITVWITLQAFLNMAANIGLIPLTGIPAPLLSYGGSSTIVTLIGIGILLNISKYSKNGE